MKKMKLCTCNMSFGGDATSMQHMWYFPSKLAYSFDNCSDSSLMRIVWFMSFFYVQSVCWHSIHGLAKLLRLSSIGLGYVRIIGLWIGFTRLLVCGLGWKNHKKSHNQTFVNITQCDKTWMKLTLGQKHKKYGCDSIHSRVANDVTFPTLEGNMVEPWPEKSKYSGMLCFHKIKALEVYSI